MSETTSGGVATFGLTAWRGDRPRREKMAIGFYSRYVTHAYPAGAAAKPINDVVVTPVAR